MKQTAVEWLWNYIMQNQFHSFEKGIIAYQQAKEMEKKQQGYSEEEVYTFLLKYQKEYSCANNEIGLKYWFEKFKKK